MSKALTVRATGFPEFLCKILVLTKQLMQDDLCLWVLPIDFNNTGHETTIMLSGSMVFGKSQIRVSERSGAQFALWAAWGLRLAFLDPHPAPGTSRSLLAQHVGPAKGEAYQSTGSQAAPSALQRQHKRDVKETQALCVQRVWAAMEHLPRVCWNPSFPLGRCKRHTC